MVLLMVTHEMRFARKVSFMHQRHRALNDAENIVHSSAALNQCSRGMVRAGGPLEFADLKP